MRKEGEKKKKFVIFRQTFEIYLRISRSELPCYHVCYTFFVWNILGIFLGNSVLMSKVSRRKQIFELKRNKFYYLRLIFPKWNLPKTPASSAATSASQPRWLLPHCACHEKWATCAARWKIFFKRLLEKGLPTWFYERWN